MFPISRVTRIQPIDLRVLVSIFCVAILSSSVNSQAQSRSSRIDREVNDSVRGTIVGSRPLSARAEDDRGALSSNTALHGMSVVFSRSADQEAALQQLLAEQQTPSSSLYHHWLTPEQFGASFGPSDADLATVQSWLQQQGFTIDGIARSKTQVRFSGTAAQVKSAFGSELHNYASGGITHYALATDLTIPAALSSVIQTVRNLSSFKPRAHVVFKSKASQASPSFTSSQSGNHYLTPKDIATIYDVNPAYNAGYTGSGQSIAVMGQSEIEISDIENFQSAAGFTSKDPTLVLVPNSGSAAFSTGDEAESDLDLEYSSTIGKGATIYFVYVGNNQNYSVWDSLQYAVDNKLSPIITLSYGDCEPDLGSADYASLNSILEQGASQGQSIINSSGDSGSTSCYGTSGLSTSVQEELAASFPASSQYVTGLGGSEFLSADVASTNTTYWQSANGTDVISSALSYIAEQAWNDDSSSDGLSSGGGGASIFTARPSWQSGVTGIPSGSYRLVPDISLDSSPNNAGYLYCSSDSEATGITGSCSNGFRDSNSKYLTVAGGTSFAAPIFAGMLSLINQKLGSSGQGVINSTLYSLAANTSTYASAFHDITSGSNECTAGSSYCSSAGQSAYATTTGYDQATGLGSIDLYNLLAAWPGSTSSSLASTTTTLSAATSTPASGANDVITIQITSNSTTVTATPTGTLNIAVDGTTVSSSLALSGGSAQYTFSSTTSGSHVIDATYSGDSNYQGSSGSLTLTIGSSSSSKSFSLAGTNLTVADGSSGTSTVTITPAGGYTGTISWSVAINASIGNACYSLSNATVSTSSPVTAALTIYTSESACSSAGVKGSGGDRRALDNSSPKTAGADPLPRAGRNGTSSIALCGLLLCLLIGRRTRNIKLLVCLLFPLAIGIGLSGCSSSSTSESSSSDAAKGTYQVTITGTDTSNSSLTASATITLTID
jgi:subtilase family serine protease